MTSSLQNRLEYLNINLAVLTDFFRECVADMAMHAPFGPPPEPQIPQVEEVHAAERAKTDPETVVEAEDTQTQAGSYHPGSPIGCNSGINSDFKDTSAYFDYESLFDDESLYLVEPSKALGSRNEFVTPQVQTTAIEPNTQTLPLSSLLSMKCKFTEVDEGEGDSAFEAPHKEVMSDPTDLPLTMSKILQHEVSVNPSLSSQKDLEQMRAKLFPGSSSQHGDPTEQDL